MIVTLLRRIVLFLAAVSLGFSAAEKPRVLVSTDIGGTDPDDFQSMVHLLVYADLFDLEGLVSSPFGPGRKEHILQVIALYERDYPNLQTYSPRYPTPAALRAMTKEGALESPGPAGIGPATEGSEWLVRCARRADPRPLHVLVWGGIEDLAQALHDAPDILPKLRVYFIGGPNKMWSVDAYNYLETHHPKLWIIEANSTYRGWFNGGNMSGEWGNTGFVTAHIAGRGALGEFFATQLRGTIKMGDTPSVVWLIHGQPDDPMQPGWGGQFVRIWDERKSTFDRLTTAADEVEAFGTVEITLPESASGRMLMDNRINLTGEKIGGRVRFRFSPRDAKVWNYEVDGRKGAFTAVLPPPAKAARASTRLPNWWIDDMKPENREGVHAGAKTVNRWREDFLRDFAARMERAAKPKAP
ncbi:MAG: DUF1593 domain-containing protein [Verrucomicrobia bacterium]|nr:DUF1593 domain-containing protein [Verrucomicrobiota bacterium]